VDLRTTRGESPEPALNRTTQARFGGFDIEEVVTSYTVGKQAGSRGKRGELLVSMGV